MDSVDKYGHAPDMGANILQEATHKVDAPVLPLLPCGWFLDNFSTRTNAPFPHFMSIFYILDIDITTPHIWGALVLGKVGCFREKATIVHRRGKFSTVLTDLSTVLGGCGNSLSKQVPLNMGGISDSIKTSPVEYSCHTRQGRESCHPQRRFSRVKPLCRFFPSPSSLRRESSRSG